ncbi:MAG: coproporphyrinogen III oxidase family protein [Myxococcales bacterium]|nr:coproporphyrinogen III oxidase family protein [Myxococcales bacterium]
MTASGGGEGTGLYVHVPFCARACPYCDFDFVVGRRPAIDRYVAGIERELDARAAALGGPPATLYLGGGTPSLLGVDGLRRLTEAIERRLPGAGARERTVEVNPEHVDDALVHGLRDMRFDRASIGVQTLDPAGLRALGRVHGEAEAEAAIARLADAGLRVSADLIIGWPGQREDSLARDVERLLAAGAEHVSVYCLTIEAGTPWPKLVRRGLRVLPDPDAQAAMLALSESLLVAAGLRHYEVASYARPGQEARHNLLYWTWGDFLGIGPSAASASHGVDGALVRASNPRGLDAWLAGGAPEVDRLEPREAAIEGLWVGLRRLDGIDVERYLGRFPAVDRCWLEERVGRQIGRGNLEWAEAGRVLRVAPGRWFWHDSIAGDLLGGGR